MNLHPDEERELLTSAGYALDDLGVWRVGLARHPAETDEAYRNRLIAELTGPPRPVMPWPVIEPMTCVTCHTASPNPKVGDGTRCTYCATGRLP